jgi:uncharacterized protein (TIGR00251 family)
MTELRIREVNGGVVFEAKVVPGSSQTTLCGLLDGMVKIKVSAAPERGKANKCLVEFLAKTLGVRRQAIQIISGRTNPIKKVQVSGLSHEEIQGRLGANK